MSSIFQDWPPVVHTIVVGTLGYLSMIVIVRVSGNRTLSRMTAFDFIIAVSLGSLLARSMLSPTNSLVQLVAGIVVLIVLQTIVSLIAARSNGFYKAVTPQPKYVFRDGDFVRETLLREGIAEAEVLAAAREVGMRDLDDVESVVLETQGGLSVVWRGEPGSQPTTKNVLGTSHPGIG